MKTVQHQGRISHISGQQVTVDILSVSACANCSSKSLCQLSESKEKQIQVHVDQPEKYTLGQEINVVLQENLGLVAVFWAYIMPFILLIIALFSLIPFLGEVVGGCIAIAIAALYFLCLRLFSHIFQRQFEFRLQKKDE